MRAAERDALEALAVDVEAGALTTDQCAARLWTVLGDDAQVDRITGTSVDDRLRQAASAVWPRRGLYHGGAA